MSFGRIPQKIAEKDEGFFSMINFKYFCLIEEKTKEEVREILPTEPEKKSLRNKYRTKRRGLKIAEKDEGFFYV